jgi:cytochrome c oxidase assembly protein subunit 15
MSTTAITGLPQTPSLAAGSGAPWLHGLAIATFLAVLPLIFLGAEVTTKGVGMVDQASVREPWFFFKEWLHGQLQGRGLGWMIEHGHRQVGWIVGLLAILTAAVACLGRSPRAIKVFSVLALVAVTTQGILGIFRVQLNAWMGSNLALVHGSFAQIVVAMLLTQAVITSRNWSIGAANVGKLPWLRRWAVATAGAAFLQVVFGGMIRHLDSTLGARLHMLVAFVVFAFVFVTIKYARETDYASFKRLARVLMALLTIQVLLGVEAFFAWLKRTTGEPVTESVGIQIVRSGHYVVGTLLFASLVLLAVKAFWTPRAEATT